MAKQNWTPVRGLAAAGVLCLAAASFGQTREQVQAWLEAEIDASYELIYPFPDFDGGGLSWVSERYVEGEALRRLDAELAGKPDHPDRTLLEQSLRRERGEPFGNKYTVWTDGEDRWRISMDFYSASDVHYWDAVYAPRRQWSLTGYSLTILDPGRPPIPQADVRAFARDALDPLQLLLAGRLPTIRGAGFGGVEFEIRDLFVSQSDSFGFRAVRPGSSPEVSFVFSGIWSQEHNRGFIAAVAFESSGDPDIDGSRHEFHDWSFHPEISTWVAGSVMAFDARGDHVETLSLVRVIQSIPGELDRITQIPSIDGADPIRGPLTVRMVTDFRDDRVDVIDEAGNQTAYAIPTTAPESRARLRYIGWSLLIAAVTGIGYFAFRRYKTMPGS